MIPLEAVAPVAATGLFSVAWLMIALPAVGAAWLLAFGKTVPKAGPLIGVATIASSFALACALFVQMLAASPRRTSMRAALPRSGGMRTIVLRLSMPQSMSHGARVSGPKRL